MKNGTVRLSFVIFLGIPTIIILLNVSWFISNSSRSDIRFIQSLNIHAYAGFDYIRDRNLSASLNGRLRYDLGGIPFPIPIPNNTVLLGKNIVGEERERFLTIGIPSVWREDNYLTVTVDTILKETSLEEQNDVFIFILLADADLKVRFQRARNLNRKYKKEIESGLLKVLQPPLDLYRYINSTTRNTYNDSADRVRWRVKQALDYAFLFWYTWTVQPSTYYLVLEDDILSATNFVSAIKEFVKVREHYNWVSLELSSFLIIGQLLHCKDLSHLATFLLLFHREHPVDILFKYWISLMAPESPPNGLPTRRIPGLFQHIGIHSTLANKTQLIKDLTFGLNTKKFSRTNPEALVVTTMKQYQTYGPQQVYSDSSSSSSSPGIFWGIPKPGDTFDIIFAKRLNVSRVVVCTGANLNNNTQDRLDYGILEVSSRFLRMYSPRKASCEGFTTLQMFKKGSVDVKHLRQLFPEGIQCIRINIGTKQKSWIIINEIAIHTDGVS